MSMSEPENPCLSCGACCCLYRVSFYWGEADDAPGGRVPAALTVQVTPMLRAMQGTHPIPQRCVALGGEPGREVACAIYPQRPSTCREFDAWLEDGTPDPRCTAARQRMGFAAVPARAQA